MATFVLVHGAWHGGWCWHKIVARLEARGHRVLAPDLPGHGRNGAAGPSTYAGYVAAVADLLRGEAEPVVLVGHSMGGAVITGAAEAAPDKVSSLVYLAAFLAPSGRSMFEGVAANRNAAEVAAAAAKVIAPGPDGSTTVLLPEGVGAMLYADCSDEDVALAKLCLTPQAVEVMAAPVTWTAERWGRIPRAYIACDQDVIKGDAAAQKVEVDEVVVDGGPDTEFIVMPASHSPFFSMPDALTDILERLAP
jgi:pimeloyl-ACP methyl ester carboxylesterase